MPRIGALKVAMDGNRLNNFNQMDYKKRVASAIGKWSEKQLPKNVERKKSNDNPEGKFVLALKKHLESIHWSIDIVESKAVYSEASGRYIAGKARPGFPDMVGNTPDGISVWIEAKAPGRRNTIRPEQRDFLIEKISSNCFAICCDSIEYFDRISKQWRASENRKALLLKELPELSERWKKIIDRDPWFD